MTARPDRNFPARPVFALALVSSLLAASCGGGGSSAVAPAPAPAPTPTPTVPALASPGMRMATVGGDAVNIVIANTGGDVTGCSAPSAGAATARLPAGLAVGVAESGGKMTCAITGMVGAAAEVGTYTVVITAASAGGPAMAMVTIVVRLRPPALADVIVRVELEQGVQLGSPIRFPNTGGAVADGACSVSPALPMGLSLLYVEPAAETATCEISGMPSVAVPSSTYTVTATNTGGTDMASATFTVAAAQTIAPDILDTAASQGFVVDFPIAPLRFINTGGDVAADGCSGALPKGLALRIIDTLDSPASCEIFGTPDEASSSASYTITATNSVGPDTATVSIAVAAAVAATTAPNLTGVDNARLTAGTRGFVDIPNNSGAVSVNGCSVTSGTLPTGLAVTAAVPVGGGTPTCRISGTAASTAPAALIEITGTNSHGGSMSRVIITIIPPPPALADIRTPQTALAGNEITPIVFINTGGGEVGCTAASELPMGLMAGPTGDMSSCQITGMPEAVAAEKTYAVTASNAGGVSKGEVVITVTALPAPASAAAAAFGRGKIALTWQASPGATLYRVLRGATDMQADAAVVSPAGGVAGTAFSDEGLDDNTAYHYWVLPCNALGCSLDPATATATATTLDPAVAPILERIGIPGEAPRYRYEIGRSYPVERGIRFTNSGASITGCTVADANLPDGLSIDTDTCEITGAPTRTSAEVTEHTVTATSAMDSDTVLIEIETHDVSPPKLSSQASQAISLADAQTAGFPITLPNAGGLPTERRAVSAAGSIALNPYGLAVRMSGRNCELGLVNANSGFSGSTGSFSLLVEAVNAAGSSTAALDISVGSGADPSAIEVAGGSTDFTFTANSAITPITFTRTGRGLCTVTGASDAPLPEGLAADRATCEISGTPTKATAKTTYTATLSRGTASASDDITIAVTDAAPALEASASADLFQGRSDRLPLIVAATAGVPTSCTAASSGAQAALADHNLFIYATGAGCAIDSVDGQGPAPDTNGAPYTLSYEISASNEAGSTTSASALTLAVRPRSPITVGLGDKHTCATNTTGRLFCWGGMSPALGLGYDSNVDITHIASVGEGTEWASVSAGDNHTCATTASGELHCWGHGAGGRLGLGNVSDATAPGRVGTRTDWASVSASGHTCATTTSGQLHCWGEADDGLLGLGDGVTSDVTAPRRVGTRSDWATVSVGRFHTCATTTSGQLHCWGKADDGRLGLGDSVTSDATAPQRVGDLTGWASVSAGGFHTCATTTSGQLHCWGEWTSGRLGLGDGLSSDLTAPQRVGTRSDWASVVVGLRHTCATTTSGQLHCWGVNTDSPLGLGPDMTGNQNTPVQVVGEAMDLETGWLSVWLGSSHTCGARRGDDGAQLWCWGSGDEGILGDGEDDAHNVLTPIQIPLP